MTENNYVTEDDDGKCFELYYLKKSIYNYPNRFMVSWWGIYSYFNNEHECCMWFIIKNSYHNPVIITTRYF